MTECPTTFSVVGTMFCKIDKVIIKQSERCQGCYHRTLLGKHFKEVAVGDAWQEMLFPDKSWNCLKWVLGKRRPGSFDEIWCWLAIVLSSEELRSGPGWAVQGGDHSSSAPDQNIVSGQHMVSIKHCATLVTVEILKTVRRRESKQGFPWNTRSSKKCKTAKLIPYGIVVYKRVSLLLLVRIVSC